MKINGKEFDFKITNIRHAAAYEKALGNIQEKEAEIKKLAKGAKSVVTIYQAFIDMLRNFFVDATGCDVLEGCEDFSDAQKVYRDFLTAVNLQKTESLSLYSPDVK